MTPGSIIAHYRIVAKLGEGGMGEVWRASDTKLGRDVAIKVLPAALSADAQYMARFEREAQTLAALNHPNIAAIYGVEQGAIVMELVEGETLPCPVPLDTALAYARQLADGLEAAHEKGIVHRDLKPANIRITPEGRVKILDFGLAKSAMESAAAAASATISPTLSLAMTQAGMILGTAAYMAPEQARGKPVDKRADIWAFGVVLYEMLTGRQVFGGGETITDTLASVVKDAPDLAALPADTPLHVRRLIERCLRKDPSKRLRDIGEARIAIDEPAVPSPVVETPAKSGRGLLPWAVAGLAVVAAGAGWWRATRPAELRPLIRMELPAGSLALSNGGALALSRDGTRFAMAARDKDGKVRLFTRLMTQGQLTPISGTEGAHSPFFSPDGRWIGFGAGGKLQKVSLDGGPPIPLCDAPTLRGASWGDDDTIVFAPTVNTPLLRIPAAGGAPAPLTALTPAERTHRWPQVLPGGQSVLFTSHVTTLNYDDAKIEVVTVKSGQRKVVRGGAYAAQYVTLPDGSGRLLYVNKNNLYMSRFDPATLEAAGDAVPVAQEIHTSATTGAGFAASAAGTLAHLLGSGSIGSMRMFWIDAAGKRQPILDTPSVYLMPRFSPDGKRLAYSGAVGSDFAIWVKDLDRDIASRVTFLPGVSQWPTWSHDGKHIVFRHTGAEPGLYWIRADGGGPAVRLIDGANEHYPISFSPDGKRLAIGYTGPTKSLDIATVLVEGDPEHPKLSAPEPFVATAMTEVQPEFSPDGRWLAYASNESGTMEVYVRPFPGPGGHWQVSTGGGNFPVWSRHGEIFYEGSDNRIYAVAYSVRGDSFAAGKPRRWSEVIISSVGPASRWDLAPDGRRAAAVIGVDDEQSANMRLVFLLNFTDELQRKTSK